MSNRRESGKQLNCKQKEKGIMVRGEKQKKVVKIDVS